MKQRGLTEKTKYPKCCVSSTSDTSCIVYRTPIISFINLYIKARCFLRGGGELFLLYLLPTTLVFANIENADTSKCRRCPHIVSLFFLCYESRATTEEQRRHSRGCPYPFLVYCKITTFSPCWQYLSPTLEPYLPELSLPRRKEVIITFKKDFCRFRVSGFTKRNAKHETIVFPFSL